MERELFWQTITLPLNWLKHIDKSILGIEVYKESIDNFCSLALSKEVREIDLEILLASNSQDNLSVQSFLVIGDCKIDIYNKCTKDTRTYSYGIDTLLSFDADNFHSTRQEIHVVTFPAARCRTEVRNVFRSAEIEIVLFELHLATCVYEKGRSLVVYT